MELAVVHETRYRYDAPVVVAKHLAHLRPIQDADQQLLQHTLHVEPESMARHEGVDAFGNACTWFGTAQPHDELMVRAASLIRLQPRFGALRADSGPAWDTAAEHLRYVARAAYDAAVEFAQPSPYVPRLAQLADYARPSFPPGRPLAEAALELMLRLHRDFAYHSESTEVDTPLAQAFEQRAGVCQDFAHLMIGALRMLGLPGRYVSGYLLTHPPDGSAELLGADASHAWVQVYCPGTAGVGSDGWLDCDPTNNLVPGCAHVRLAVGRDYGDVAPLRGVIRGGGRHALSVAVRTSIVDPGPGVASVAEEESP